VAGARDGFPVVVNGIRFETDVEAISWQTVPSTRQGSDQGAGPGEQSLSMENVWRRTRENWVAGAGQPHADIIDESSPIRFHESVGINPWITRGLQPLHSAEEKRSSTNLNLKMVSMNVGGTDFLVIVDGIKVYWSTDFTIASPTFFETTGLGATISSITSDGTRWWACDQANVYSAQAGAGAATTFSTYDAFLVGYANGRLLAAKNNELVELDSVGVPTVLYTHPNANFVWRGIVASPAGIYVHGDLGHRSEVYVITAIDATGALDVPFVACHFPTGELIHEMGSYAGVMVLATTRGLRLGLITGGGFLSIGPVIPEPGDVWCLAPQLEDVWFGTTDLTGHPGLGRARLSRFTAELVPAFASDVARQATGVLQVKSVCVINDRVYFSIDGDGFYGETASYGGFSTIDLGWFTYGISEDKILDTITVWCDQLPASCSITANVYADDSGTPLASMVMSTTGQLKQTLAYTGSTTAERMRVTLTIVQSGSTPVVVRRVTLRATPKSFVSQIITLPLFLSDEVQGQRNAVQVGQNPYDEFTALETLLKSKARFTLQVGDWSASARLEALQVEKGGLGGGNGLEGWADDGRFMAGRWDATFVTQEPTG
jgi:hypothetical protein